MTPSSTPLPTRLGFSIPGSCSASSPWSGRNMVSPALSPPCFKPHSGKPLTLRHWSRTARASGAGQMGGSSSFCGLSLLKNVRCTDYGSCLRPWPSLPRYVAFPLSGLSFETSDGYISPNDPPMVIGHTWDDFNRRQTDFYHSGAKKGWETGSPPTITLILTPTLMKWLKITKLHKLILLSILSPNFLRHMCMSSG